PSPTTTSRPRPSSSGASSACCRKSARACATPASACAAEAGAAAAARLVRQRPMGYPCPLLQPTPSPVADHPPSSGPQRSLRPPDKRGFLQKLAQFLHPGPDSKDELIETLAEAEDNDIINAESRVMLEGVIRIADMSAGDVMVA